MSGSRRFIQQVLAILIKDVKTEWRTREIVTSMFVFAVLVLVVFNFAIGADPALIRQVASGVMWVALLFATVLGLQRAGQMEGEEDSLQGLLLALYDPSVLFVAKMLGQMLYLWLVAICIVPLCGMWFRIDVTTYLGTLGIACVLGTLGLSIVGTLFAMMALHTRAREVMLPLLFIPITVPLIIAAVSATAQLMDGRGPDDVIDYITFMAIYDIVFLALVLIVFDYVIED